MWSSKEQYLKNGFVKNGHDVIFCYGLFVKPTFIKTEQSWRAYSIGSQRMPNGPAGGRTGCQ